MTSASIVETRRGPIECAVWGEGPAVLAVHGAMGGYDQSVLLARAVCEPRFRFVAVSRPGYLGTPLRVGPTAAEQADAHAALLDALGIERAAVVAISGGGPSAINFALRHRDRCRGLVLISTCAGVVESRIPLSFRLMQALMRRPAVVNMMRKKVEKNLEGALRRSIPDAEQFAGVMADAETRGLMEDLTLGMFDRMGERLEGTANDIRVTRGTEYELERVAVPALVVHGAADPLVPFEQHGKRLAERIPNARQVLLENGPHAAIFTHRAVVRPAVTRFLEELG